MMTIEKPAPVVFEPRSTRETRFSKWILVIALLIADLITIPALIGASRTANHVANTQQSGVLEQRCRAEISNNAVSEILRQQVLITDGLKDVATLATGEDFDRATFITNAEEAVKRSQSLIIKLQNAVHDCAQAH